MSAVRQLSVATLTPCRRGWVEAGRGGQLRATPNPLDREAGRGGGRGTEGALGGWAPFLPLDLVPRVRENRLTATQTTSLWSGVGLGFFAPRSVDEGNLAWSLSR